MTKLFSVTFISVALATSPALARGGFAVARIAHPNPHIAHPDPHKGSLAAHPVVDAFAGRQAHDEGFRRPGPIVIVVGGGYVDRHDAYCAQNYPKYDPTSETYLGDDGQRYLCPELAQ
jgi:BA14K-like protein